MYGDKNKFVSLKKNKDGKVILENNSPIKVLRKGRAKLNKYIRAVDVLLVQWLKQNILSVGQMEYKGNVDVFTSTKCRVIDEEYGKVIERGYRNPEKLYVFKYFNSRKYEEDSKS